MLASRLAASEGFLSELHFGHQASNLSGTIESGGGREPPQRLAQDGWIVCGTGCGDADSRIGYHRNIGYLAGTR